MNQGFNPGRFMTRPGMYIKNIAVQTSGL